ncbi:MAG: MYXO-CTERM sorting domain-containing protein, partial [Pseudomonadota bacterium]
GGACPTRFAAEGTTCRPKAGGCDVAEACTGTSTECPADFVDDVDGDSWCGSTDNCPTTKNPGQEDTDGDGIGDACETELDAGIDSLPADGGFDGQPVDGGPDGHASDASSDAARTDVQIADVLPADGSSVDGASVDGLPGADVPVITDAKPALDSPAESDAGKTDEMNVNDLYGCGCRMTGRGAQHGSTLLLAAVLLLAAGRRKRWRACFARLLAALLGLASALTLAPDASAQRRKAKEDLAREHYQAGITKYDLGQFDEAIGEFQKAFEISNAPGLLFNIAQAYRLKKDYGRARFFYQSYLRRQPDAANRQDVEARIKEIDEILATGDRTSSAPPRGTLPPEGSSNRESQPGSQVRPESPSQPALTPESPPAIQDAKPPPARPSDSTAGATPAKPPAATTASAVAPVAVDSDELDPRNSSSSNSTIIGAEGSTKTATRHHPLSLAGLLRADIAPTAPGAVFALGASLAVSRGIEVTAAATVGSHLGASLGGTFLLGDPSTRLRPFLEVALPAFFADGVQMGAQAGGGIRWQLLSNVGVRVGLGGVFVPTLKRSPKALLLAGVGIQVWR